MNASDGVLPVTAAGWFSVALSVVTVAAILIGWGKTLARFSEHQQRLDSLAAKLEDIEGEHIVVMHTLFGPRNDNGISHTVKSLITRVEAIEGRNRINDALAERMRGAASAGTETRRVHRRKEDRIAFDEVDDPDNGGRHE
jgi:hypothetical protein